MTRPRPLVSVLLPVRDGAATLTRCLRSLASQTLREHEVVAVDDGSSDDTGARLSAWAADDARVRVLHTPALGLVPALNLAALEARAEIVARMDADDTCAPERLERQWRWLREAAAPHVLGTRVAWRGREEMNAAGMRAYVEWQNELLGHEAIVRDLFVESPLVHPSVAMPAAVLRDLGGYRAFDGPEDYDLWLRAERAGVRFAKLPEVLLDWWDSPTRLTRASERYRAERFFELKVAALSERHPGREVVIWGAGPIGKSWSRALRAQGHRLRAFVEVDRRKIGTRLHGAPVLDVAGAAALGPALHLAAVGQPGARARIRAAAAAAGIRDVLDLVAVA